MDAQTMAAAITTDLVALDVEPPASKEELFRGMSACLVRSGRVRDAEAFLAALEERESLGSTFMGDGLALPHGKGATVTQASIVIWRLRSPMTYTSYDETGPVDRIVMLAVPDGGEGEHLQAVALLARLLMDDDAVAGLGAARDPHDVVDIVVQFAAARA